MIDLTPEQSAPRIASMLAAHENRTLEYKRMGDNKIVRKLLEAICAFANTEGGVLALGVADEKQGKGAARLFGIQENPEALDELTRKVRTQYHPPIETIRFLRLPCTLRDGSAGAVVLVQVPQSDKVYSIVDDGTWTRLTAGKAWVEQGVLVQPPVLAKRYTSYIKPAQPPAQGVFIIYRAR